MSLVPAHKNWGKNTWGNLAPRTMRPWSSMELGEKYLQTQECENCYVLDFSESQGNARAHSKMSRRARIRSRCRSINAHAEQKNKLTRAGHVAKIQKPDWEEQVFVHDLDLFVTNAITQRNACCSIAWKTLRRPRVFLWLGRRSKAAIDQRREDNMCKTDHFVPLVVLGLCANSGSNSSSTPTLQDLSSTSPAQERRD